MTPDMNALVAAARAGSEGALLELLRLCRPQLQRYANRQCASEDVEEAVQDALWLLYTRVGALRTLGAFSAWLFKIVRRECVRRARRHRRFVAWDEGEVSAVVDVGRSDEDLRIDLTRVLANLPRHYREILVLRDVSGFSSEEVADQLGIPVTAAKSRLHRARHMARVQLQGGTCETASQWPESLGAGGECGLRQ